MKPAQPDFTPLEHKKYVLHDTWGIDYDSNALGRVSILVALGFVMDGESSPPLVWGLWGAPLDATNAPQATAHDALYKSHLTDRKTADLIWLEIAKLNEVGFFERQAKYRMLRLFGGKAWKNNKHSVNYWRLFVKVNIEEGR